MDELGLVGVIEAEEEDLGQLLAQPQRCQHAVEPVQQEHLRPSLRPAAAGDLPPSLSSLRRRRRLGSAKEGRESHQEPGVLSQGPWPNSGQGPCGGGDNGVGTGETALRRNAESGGLVPGHGRIQRQWGGGADEKARESELVR